MTTYAQTPLAFLCISQGAVERVVTLPARSPEKVPIRLFFSAADLELAVDFFHHGFATAVAPGQRMLVLMSCRSPYSVGDLLSRGLTRLSVQAVAHGPMQSPQAAVEAILQNRIDCLVGVPSEMAALSRYPGRKQIPAGLETIRKIGCREGYGDLLAEGQRAFARKKGKYKGAVLDREKFEQMKDKYYNQRGWDPKTGIPTREKLTELGLEDAI